MIRIEKKCGNDQGRPWVLGKVPAGYWDIQENRLSYMQWLGQRLGFVDDEDWYGISQQHFKRNRGGGLLNGAYKDSPQAAVKEFMPDRKWWPWLFKSTPQGFWKDIRNRRMFMKWLEKQLEIQRKEDWYRVTKKDFRDHGGSGLLQNYYGSSVSAAITEYKPRMRFELWRFQMVPQGFWSSAENRQQYMDWLGKKLGIRTPEMWYGLTPEDVRRHYGHTLLRICGGSVFRLVYEYLPDFDWKPWLFQSAPNGFWKVGANRQAYLCWLGSELGFRKPTDWYKLTHGDFKRTGGGGLFAMYYGNSLTRAAQERYPNHAWKPERFQHYAKIV